ncbi:hypothetical protein V4F39_03680 [Aquincola sp. MAHUQ-54]|uniref:Uncharacterized protein n=1 Tax=Aquincola agrisoli TaxID=3119538 RepID=A0AAW9Q0X3_9BURK
MDDLDRLPCIKQGLWFYGGVTCCHVRIVRDQMLHGSHDADDPPELALDRMMDCFYVRYDLPHAPRQPADWHDGGAALSLREAVFLAERRLGPSIHWND